MPNQMVVKEHEEPPETTVIEPFTFRTFDKPDFFSDPPGLGMVKLDPNHDKLAKIRQTLADSYDALINQIGLDPHQQDGTVTPTNMKSGGQASGRYSSSYIGNNTKSNSTIKFWNFSLVPPPT